MPSHEVDTNKEKILAILTNSLGDRAEAEYLLRLVEWQAYSDGFVAGMGGAENQGEGWDQETP